jgi:hypothetical protein
MLDPTRSSAGNTESGSGPDSSSATTPTPVGLRSRTLLREGRGSSVSSELQTSSARPSGMGVRAALRLSML